MRKKSGFTIVEQAIALVPEFENVVRKLDCFNGSILKIVSPLIANSQSAINRHYVFQSMLEQVSSY